MIRALGVHTHRDEFRPATKTSFSSGLLAFASFSFKHTSGIARAIHGGRHATANQCDCASQRHKLRSAGKWKADR